MEHLLQLSCVIREQNDLFLMEESGVNPGCSKQIVIVFLWVCIVFRG